MKLVMALPMHIAGEKFMEMTMDIIRGRYGKDGYYSGVQPFAELIVNPAQVSVLFQRGYAGKNGVHYYTIEADELDPVIIATMEELGEMVGLDYKFVFEKGAKNVAKDWWKPSGNFQNAPHYYESKLVAVARESYRLMLESVEIGNGKIEAKKYC